MIKKYSNLTFEQSERVTVSLLKAELRYSKKSFGKRYFFFGFLFFAVIDIFIILLRLIYTNPKGCFEIVANFISSSIALIAFINIFVSVVIFFAKSFTKDKLVYLSISGWQFFIILLLQIFAVIALLLKFFPVFNDLTILLLMIFITLSLSLMFVRSRYRSLDKSINIPIDDEKFWDIDKLLKSKYMWIIFVVLIIYKTIKNYFFKK